MESAVIVSLDELVTRTLSIPWLSRIGAKESAEGVFFWQSPQLWRSTFRATFDSGAPSTEAADPFGWLLPERYEHDEAFRARMNELRAAGQGEEIKRITTMAYDAVLESVGTVLPQSEWLDLGDTDAHSVVMNFATFAAGQAAKEIFAGVGTFWQRVFTLYERGRFPIGKVYGNSTIVAL